MDKIIIFVFVAAALFFLFNIFMIYNKRYKREKIERDIENSRIDTLSSIRNGKEVVLLVKGVWRKSTIINNDTKNRKMFIHYTIDKQNYNTIYEYNHAIFNDIETVNPGIIKKITLKDLKVQLEEAVLNENYEEAERLRNEINKIKLNSQS